MARILFFLQQIWATTVNYGQSAWVWVRLNAYDIAVAAVVPTILVSPIWFLSLFGVLTLVILWPILWAIHFLFPIQIGQGEYWLLVEKNNRRWACLVVVSVFLTIATIFSPWGDSVMAHALYSDAQDWAWLLGMESTLTPPEPWTIFWRRFWATLIAWPAVVIYTVVAFSDELTRAMGHAGQVWEERRQQRQERRARAEGQPGEDGENERRGRPPKAKGWFSHGWSQALFVFMADIIGDIILHRRT